MPENDGSTFFMGQFIQVSLMKNINYELLKRFENLFDMFIRRKKDSFKSWRRLNVDKSFEATKNHCESDVRERSSKYHKAPFKKPSRLTLNELKSLNWYFVIIFV